jgi:dUTP pyrophosphatase
MSYDVHVKVKKLREDAVIPEYATPGAAGFDLVAAEDVIIEPGETKLVPTGLAFEIPQGYELQVRMRSGIAKRTKLRLPNAVGTIDSDYRGEVFMMFENTGKPFYTITTNTVKTLKGPDVIDEEFPMGTYLIRKGDRVAQGVIVPVMRAQFIEVDELSDTERGAGGFGSTGVK